MIRNRLLFVILLVFFACMRLGIDSWSAEEVGSFGRKPLAVNEGSTVEGFSTEGHDEYTSEYAYSSNNETEDDEPPEQAASCDSKFDGTIGFVLFLLGVLYCFVGLAIICEGEFKDSVVEIARFLKLPPDVAGATLMAAGTSSPELFTSLVAIAGPVADIGTGTVVGSAIFNILIIIGGCVLFSSYTFHLNWKPVLRDCIVNLISFIFLYIIFYDQLIYWYEAFIGCFMYVLYVAMMGVNTHIMNAFEAISVFAVKKMPFLKVCAQPDPESEEPSNVQLLDDYEERNSMELTSTEMGVIVDEDASAPSADILLSDQLGDMDNDLSDFPEDPLDKPRSSLQEDKDFDEPEEHHEHFPTSAIGWVWFVLAWPYEIMFHYTIPRTNGKFKYQFFATFLISLAWLGVFTTFMVKWTEKIGCILGIEDAIMGVTFLAIGTSMPDCLTSIFVARTGRGNMAVCNALGSNVFDILLALSLPWALSTVISRSPVAVSSDTLVQDVLILTGTLATFLVVLCLNRWRLNKKIGYLFYFLYAVFVTYTVIRELLF